MASSTSNAAMLLGDVHASVYFKQTTHKGFIIKPTHVSLRRPNQQLFYAPLNFCRSTFHASCSRIQNSSLVHRPSFKSLCTSSSDCYLDHSSPPPDEQLEPNLTTLDRKPLKMLSGSCYLPHPNKVATGGEDAHFICADEQVIGVADGVGGWAKLGVDAGLFARELISNSVIAVKEETKGCFNPVRVLEKARSNTKAMGSSTACIIALKDKALNAINLGDSGFIVIRDGSIIFKSPVQHHGFNYPYQLGSDNAGDLPRSGEVFIVPVEPGDVIVAGTDGLFDNLYTNDITALVVCAIIDRLEPQVTALKIAALAQELALENNWQSPFSAAALEAGHHFSGGKLDDITVVVSYISSSVSE